jgi:hypothetical protein
MDNKIRGEAVAIEKHGGRLDLKVLDRDGNIQTTSVLLWDHDLFVEDGTFIFSSSHEAKTTLLCQ